MTRSYSLDEDALIVELYDQMTIAEIARRLGRDPGALAQHCQLLRRQGTLTKQRFYAPRWTAEEDDLLRDRYGQSTVQALAARLQRSVSGVRCRAFVLGVTMRENVWTAQDVASLFGVDHHKVVDQWLASGLLGARRVENGKGRGYYWTISDRSIDRFIRAYPWHYDRTRIERGTYHRNLAEQVWRADPVLTVDEAAEMVDTHREVILRHIRRGWLRAERTWCAGKHGRLYIRSSWLAVFHKRRRPTRDAA